MARDVKKNMISQKRKKIKSFFFFLSASIIGILFFFGQLYFYNEKSVNSFLETENKIVFLESDSLNFILKTGAKNVEQLLRQQGFEINQNDEVHPNLEAKLFNGSHVFVQKARKIIVDESGEKKEFFTLRKTVGEAVREKKELNVGEDDIINPKSEFMVENGMAISITHVKVERETREEMIAFKIIENENDKLGWREQKVTAKGEKGKKEIIYEVVYYDGKEIKRKKIDEHIIKNPVDEIITRGTYVKVGKVHTGFGSWYAQPKYLETKYPSISGYWAANPWLSMGSYAKVTNKNNGKSVIVKINDRGPFGPNRIIDLGKSAFAAIAPLGAGIIDVKMEEIKN